MAYEEKSRWALVWPIAIGVLLGNILTVIIGLIASALFAGAVLSMLRGGIENLGTTSGHLPARMEPTTDHGAKPTLPTINSALSDGSSQACLDDQVVEYHAREWVPVRPLRECFTIPD